MTNRHPVDQLAEIRATIKELQARETQLKEQVIDALADAPQRGETQVVRGDDFVASVSLVVSERLDRAAVEKALTPARFQKCLKESQALTVRVEPRAKLAA